MPRSDRKDLCKGCKIEDHDICGDQCFSDDCNCCLVTQNALMEAVHDSRPEYYNDEET